MLVVLEGFEEVVVFGKGLIGASSGHVIGTILEFFPPKGDGFLPFIANISINQSLQLLSGGNLSFVLEAIGDPQILIDILNIDSPAILIVHNQSSDDIFSQWFGDKRVPVCGGENAFAGLLLALFLFLRYLLGDLLEVLDYGIYTIC